MKIGIFIGSFNPPHLGHLDIMNYLLDRNNNYLNTVMEIVNSLSLIVILGFLNSNLKIIDRLNCSHIPIQKVTSELINNDLINNLKDYSNSVINKVFGLLRKAFNKAVLLNVLPSNPFNIDGLIIKPKSNNITKTIDSLTIEEQLIFLNELLHHQNNCHQL